MSKRLRSCDTSLPAFANVLIPNPTSRNVFSVDRNRHLTRLSNKNATRTQHLGLFFACEKKANPNNITDESNLHPTVHRNNLGEVFLVGTGPGDPNMLTIGAIDAMKFAEVVLYDRLVSEEILKYINPAAEKILVGKGRGIGTGSQDAIDKALYHHALRGKRVVRLKGGDPSIFGRVGSEISFLQNNGVSVSIVPGITSASGIAASLGFPLTHGDVADGVILLTAHSKTIQLDYLRFDRLTLVLYMGLNELESIMEQLLMKGIDSTTAVVAVQSGTTSKQVAVWGMVGNISRKVRRVNLQSPTLIIVGNVVRFASDWQSENPKQLST